VVVMVAERLDRGPWIEFWDYNDESVRVRRSAMN
jgi:hypothetical protein